MQPACVLCYVTRVESDGRHLNSNVSEFTRRRASGRPFVGGSVVASVQISSELTFSASHVPTSHLPTQLPGNAFPAALLALR